MRVVIADDQVLLRAGLVELLTVAGFDVVGQAGNADELLALVRTTLPDVAVIDIRMPPTHTLEGLRAAQAIRAEYGSCVGILLLSQHVESQYARELLTDDAGGVGYLLKDRILDPGELADAVRRVGDGGSVIDPVVIQGLLQRRTSRPLSTLTPRERDVLAGMAEGRSNQAIAAQLYISDKTVEACTGRIFAKLDLHPGPDDHRRVRAVLTYLEEARSVP